MPTPRSFLVPLGLMLAAMPVPADASGPPTDSAAPLLFDFEMEDQFDEVHKFPKEPAEWALVDWKGEFAKRYGWTKNEANVLVFDAEGRLAARAHGREPPESEIRRILAAIEATVAAAGSEDPAAPPTAAEATGSGADGLE